MHLKFTMQGITAKKASEGVDVNVGPIDVEVEYTPEEFTALVEKQPELMAQLVALLK